MLYNIAAMGRNKTNKEINKSYKGFKRILSVLLLSLGHPAFAEHERVSVQFPTRYESPATLKALITLMASNGWTLTDASLNPHEESLVLDFDCSDCDIFVRIPTDLLHLAGFNDRVLER